MREEDCMKNMVICGLGYISSRVAEGCLLARGMRLYGLCSQSLEKAQIAADRYDVQTAYGSYAEVLEDPMVDAVYLCTPNGTHVAMARQALLAGKSVICEKPLAPNTTEARELFSLARERGVLLMEAVKTVFSPLLHAVREQVRAGAIGDLYLIEADYCYDMAKAGKQPSDWIFGPGGGCSLDIGVYPAALALLFAEAPTAQCTTAKRTLGYPVDAGMQALVEFQNGVVAHLASSWLRDVPDKGSATLSGTRGTVRIPAYWKAREAYLTCGGEQRTITADFESDFTPEIEAAAAAMDQGLSEVPGVGERETLVILRMLGC